MGPTGTAQSRLHLARHDGRAQLEQDEGPSAHPAIFMWPVRPRLQYAPCCLHPHGKGAPEVVRTRFCAPHSALRGHGLSPPSPDAIRPPPPLRRPRVRLPAKARAAMPPTRPGAMGRLLLPARRPTHPSRSTPRDPQPRQLDLSALRTAGKPRRPHRVEGSRRKRRTNQPSNLVRTL